MKKSIRIASGQGFWGDLPSAPFDQVRNGPIDYLVMDYLAEVTMSIMQKQKLRDPQLGYAKDLVPLLDELLPELKEKNIRVITNGGGVNPIACRDTILEKAKKKGIKNLRIAVVYGDDILARLDSFAAQGILLNNMETDEPLSAVRDRVISANVYFGAHPIVEALQQGADIIITGRTTDTGLTLAPMIFEFNWNLNDWDKLAAGTVAGHILECGAQATGGNFSKNWKSVPDIERIGFPIAEAYPDASIVITKHDKLGGLVTVASVSEQLLYEIGDPRSYITPDGIADFTTIQLRQAAKNRVEISGVKGKPSTEFYKVSMSYHDGYSATGTLTYAWPEALEKAKKADQILRARLMEQGLHFEEIRTEFLGYDSCFGPRAESHDELNEVILRIGVRSQDRSYVDRFSKELAPLILTGPPGVTGFAGGRPKPSDVIAYWPALIPKSAVSPILDIAEL